jgi:hypothetical protein
VEDLLSLVNANQTQIEAAGVNLLSYIAPGDEYAVPRRSAVRSGGPVTRLIESEPVDDVHGTEGTTGRAARPVTTRERRPCCSFTAARRPMQ